MKAALSLGGVVLKEWITFISTLLMAVYLIIVLLALFFTTRKKAERFDRFCTTMTRGLETGKIVKLQDCIDISRGISGPIDDAQLTTRVTQWLRQYLVKLISDQVSVSQSFKSNTAKDQISSFIREMERSDPYARLPQAERGLVTDISRAIEDNNSVLAQSKAHDLASLIEARSEHSAKLERSNRWSIPLAVIGLIVSVAFGLVSLHW
jgi:hypothetical protein